MTKKARTRASAVVVYGGRLLCIKAVDPHSKKVYLILPGGEVEAGETPEEAAVRETYEETGYKVETYERQAIGTRTTKRYDFLWNNIVYDCTTHFLRAELISSVHSPDKVDDADYIKGYEWVSLTKLNETFDYHKDILDAIMELTE